MPDRRPSAFTDSYNIKSHVYPPSLGTTQENANYVVFYINVPENSKIKAGSGFLGAVEPIAGTIASSGKGFFETKPYKRLADAVALPIATRPSVKYGADWDMTSLGPVVGWALTESLDREQGIVDAFKTGGAGQGWEAIKKRGSEVGGVVGNALKAVALSTLNTASNIVGLGGEAGTADIFSIITRTALNEHRTQLFKSMRFRSFAFEYHFYPRNEEEARMIRNIIHLFKIHMHPETGNSNLFLTYPSEFDIVFYYGQNENAGASNDLVAATSTDGSRQNMFKISSCALTDLEVDYGGEQFYTFVDGMPTEISLRMGFMELELLTAERIKEGF